ncbi:hypothetical protein CEXT_222881 [Caerostris extrusa]|uniref:Uncharacterized protein n=1 Tax=Caerostris extrusa TaxID=172846 RepID=A0AAV4NP62_CAEEX|nr:hypothetical protein CEXT_222881 [Caerostris extrusa]
MFTDKNEKGTLIQNEALMNEIKFKSPENNKLSYEAIMTSLNLIQFEFPTPAVTNLKSHQTTEDYKTQQLDLLIITVFAARFQDSDNALRKPWRAGKVH